jgi:hypothetical protein
LIILFALQSVTDLQFKKSCCPAWTKSSTCLDNFIS